MTHYNSRPVYCIVCKMTRYRLPLTVLLLACSTTVWSFDLDDPLATAVGTAAPSQCQAADTTALTLATAVRQALCRNPDTQISWGAVQAQAAALGVARAAYLPTLDAGASYARTHTDSARSGAFITNTSGNYSQTDLNLTLSYLLLDFGGRAAGRDQASALLDAAIASHQRSVQQLLFDTVQAYYNLRAARALVDATQEAQATAKASLDAAEARHQLGVATPADVLQAQTAHSQAQLARIRAEGTLRINRGQLASVMQLPADTPLRLAPEPPDTKLPDLATNAHELIALALQTRPDLAAAQARVQAAQADIQQAQASGRPSISLAASTGRSKLEGLDSNASSRAQLNLNIPLFTGFTTTYRVRQARAEQEQAQQRSAQLQQQIGLDVWTGYQQLQTAQQALTSTRSLVRSASASQKVALGRYKAGVGSVLDLLNAQSALADAQQQNVSARYTLDTARTRLALALGGLNLDTLTGTVAAHEHEVP